MAASHASPLKHSLQQYVLSIPDPETELALQPAGSQAVLWAREGAGRGNDGAPASGTASCGRLPGVRHRLARVDRHHRAGPQGRRTRSILVLDDDHIVLSAINPETIASRLELEAGEEA